MMLCWGRAPGLLLLIAFGLWAPRFVLCQIIGRSEQLGQSLAGCVEEGDEDGRTTGDRGRKKEWAGLGGKGLVGVR